MFLIIDGFINNLLIYKICNLIDSSNSAGFYVCVFSNDGTVKEPSLNYVNLESYLKSINKDDILVKQSRLNKTGQKHIIRVVNFIDA